MSEVGCEKPLVRAVDWPWNNPLTSYSLHFQPDFQLEWISITWSAVLINEWVWLEWIASWAGTAHYSFFFILLFYSQICFLTSIILWIFSHYSHYSPWLRYVRSIEGLARDSVDVELTVYYRTYTGRKELENEDDRAEKADWQQSQTLLARCSWCCWMWTSMMPSSQSVVTAWT